MTRLKTVLNAFENLINTHVDDIKPGRTGRWIFPTFANNDVNLPQITIQIGNPTFEYASGGNDYWQKNDAGEDVYARTKKLPLHLYVLTRKSDEIEITENGESKILTNQLLNLHLVEKIKETIFRYRNDFLREAKLEEINITNMDLVFEDTPRVWASDITCELTLLDNWQMEYEANQLINNYELSKQVTLHGG